MKSTTLCFLLKDNKILLAMKKKGKVGVGYLNGYGGGVEEGENPEQAIVREVNEEAGIELKPESLNRVGIIDFFRAGKQIFVCSVYFALGWTGEPKESDEMALPETYSMSAIPYDKMFKGDVQWLSHVLRGERIHGRVYYNENFELERFESEPYR